MAMNRKSGLYSLLVTAILLAVGIVLPFLTGNVQVLGQAISPLHIPVLICGLTCGWCWGPYPPESKSGYLLASFPDLTWLSQKKSRPIFSPGWK